MRESLAERIVGSNELAEMFGLTLTQFYDNLRFSRSANFPKPMVYASKTPLWDTYEIKEWAELNGIEIHQSKFPVAQRSKNQGRL